MYKLFLFDLDGTLLDSDPALAETFKKLYQKYRPGYMPSLDYMTRFSGPPIRETLLNEFPNQDQQLMFDEFLRYIDVDYVSYASAFPYSKEMLLSFKRNNVLFGLVTSKAKESTEYVLNVIGLDNLFDFIICADEVKNVKPDPEGIYRAMEYFKVKNKDEVIYIGDGIHDYLTAQNAGIKFGYVAFSPRKLPKDAKIDLLIEDFKQLTKEVTHEDI